MQASFDIFKGARCVVTGAGGTVGKELCKQLIELGASEIRALDNSETALWNLENEIPPGVLRCFLVDICKEDHIKRYFHETDFVFHAAALKHVPFCEKQPHAAIETNVRGVEAVINAAIHCRVKRVLFTSSDKAVNSTNLMGATKFVGERMITAANNLVSKDNGTRFASTRFGNVAMSNGSVIPRFVHQIENGLPLTVTERDMTRFMMSIEDSVSLVIKSMALMQGGEVFVTQMPVVRIGDLADVLVEQLAPLHGHEPGAYPVEIIGVRAGEKFYEELTTDEEIPRSWEIGDLIVVLPAFRNIYGYIDYSWYEREGVRMKKVYHSHHEPCLSCGEIKEFLSRLGILEIAEREKSKDTDMRDKLVLIRGYAESA